MPSLGPRINNQRVSSKSRGALESASSCALQFSSMSLETKGGVTAHALVYALVPAQPLPAVDLSKSFRGRLLPGFLHSCVRRRYYRYHRQILLCAAVSHCSSFLVALVPASMGRVFAFLAVFLWVPSGFGSVTTLRYDIVRLVCRTFDFWFFSIITSVVVVTMSMYFSDLRWVRMIIEWFGLHHVILIDAHVLGLRNIIYILIFGMMSLVLLLVWIMLGRVDGGSTFTVLKYENTHGGFELSGLDVIGNGLVSLGLLLAKIIFRRRMALRMRRKRSSSLVECVIYRCRLKLELVQRPDDSRYNSKDTSLREADSVQHLIFVKFPQKFDATNTLLPCRIMKQIFVPSWLIMVLYSVGVVGFVFSRASFFYEFGDSVEDISHKRLELLVSWISLLCTLTFTTSFAVLYQRQLLRLLFNSFDFVFYSFQITSANICVCRLYNWDLPHCLMALSWWVWAHWIFTLDALTPTMRCMLKFRVCYAAPVLCVLLLDHVGLIYRILLAGDTQLQDSVIYEGIVWTQHLTIRVVPFYVSRSLTLVLWCSRLFARLSSASDDAVTILRGSVCYDNFFANGRRTNLQLTQVVGVTARESLSRHTQVSPTVSFHRD